MELIVLLVLPTALIVQQVNVINVFMDFYLIKVNVYNNAPMESLIKMDNVINALKIVPIVHPRNYVSNAFLLYTITKESV